MSKNLIFGQKMTKLCACKISQNKKTPCRADKPDELKKLSVIFSLSIGTYLAISSVTNLYYIIRKPIVRNYFSSFLNNVG